MLKQLKIKDYLLLGLALVIIVMLIFWPKKESKFEKEREKLAEIIETQTETVHRLQFDTLELNRENRRLEEILNLKLAELHEVRKQRPAVEAKKTAAKAFTDLQQDSSFQKLFPVPDSILFSSGSKATYIIHVQKQAYEGLIELDYATQMVLAMDSTINVFESLVAQKNAIIGNQKETIVALTDLNETLLLSQVNDLGEISKLRKKKRFAGFIIKVGIPAALIGGVYLGSKL